MPELDRDTVYTIITLVCLALMVAAAVHANRKMPAERFMDRFDNPHDWRK